MSKSKPSMNALRAYEDFIEYIPHRVTKRQILNMSGSTFPAFVKAYPRATPLWREGDVIEWIVANYSEVLTEYCDRLEREGLSSPGFSHGNPV